MKIVFMGTPDFSVPALDALYAAGHEIAAVVTQPDKPKGRGNVMQMTPVKIRANELDIPVLTPIRVRGNVEFLQTVKEIAPDVIVVIAYGQILDKPILTLPRYGCVNIHASLLPKYRGAAPIQWAVIDGEEFSGVTTMQMDEGLDTGDMLDRCIVKIERDETGGSLFDKLAKAGGELIVETLAKIEAGTSKPIPQSGESSYVGIITKAMGEIDWNKSAAEIERLIRGLNPWPSAYTYLGSKTLKLWRAEVKKISDNRHALPGEIIDVAKDEFTVCCKEDALTVKELQLEGKKRMDCGAFLRGFSLAEGIRLDHKNA